MLKFAGDAVIVLFHTQNESLQKATRRYHLFVLVGGSITCISHTCMGKQYPLRKSSSY